MTGLVTPLLLSPRLQASLQDAGQEAASAAVNLPPPGLLAGGYAQRQSNLPTAQQVALNRETARRLPIGDATVTDEEGDRPVRLAAPLTDADAASLQDGAVRSLGTLVEAAGRIFVWQDPTAVDDSRYDFGFGLSPDADRSPNVSRLYLQVEGTFAAGDVQGEIDSWRLRLDVYRFGGLGEVGGRALPLRVTGENTRVVQLDSDQAGSEPRQVLAFSFGGPAATDGVTIRVRTYDEATKVTSVALGFE